MEESFRMTLTGIVLWCILFLTLRKVFCKLSFDFCNRIVSLIHVGVALWLSSISVQDWRTPLYPLASPPTPAQARALRVSLSYFIYDFVCCMFGTGFSISDFFHHSVSILGIGGGLMYGTCGSELTGCLWLTEISNPFLHLRQMLKELHYKDSTLGLLNDICFAISFAFARSFVGPYLLYVTVTNDNPWIIKVTAAGLQAVSLFWLWKIIRVVRIQMLKRTTPRKAD